MSNEQQQQVLNRTKVEDSAKYMNEACVEVVLDHLLNIFVDNKSIEDKVDIDFIIENLQYFRQAEHWQTAFESDLEEALEEFLEALYVPIRG